MKKEPSLISANGLRVRDIKDKPYHRRSVRSIVGSSGNHAVREQFGRALTRQVGRSLIPDPSGKNQTEESAENGGNAGFSPEPEGVSRLILSTRIARLWESTCNMGSLGGCWIRLDVRPDGTL